MFMFVMSMISMHVSKTPMLTFSNCYLWHTNNPTAINRPVGMGVVISKISCLALCTCSLDLLGSRTHVDIPCFGRYDCAWRVCAPRSCTRRKRRTFCSPPPTRLSASTVPTLITTRPSLWLASPGPMCTRRCKPGGCSGAWWPRPKGTSGCWTDFPAFNSYTPSCCRCTAECHGGQGA